MIFRPSSSRTQWCPEATLWPNPVPPHSVSLHVNQTARKPIFSFTKRKLRKETEKAHTAFPTCMLSPARWHKPYPAASLYRLVRTGANFTMKRKGRAHVLQQRFSNLLDGSPRPTQKLKENFTDPFIQRSDALGRFLACSIRIGKNDKTTAATWEPTAGLGEQRSQPRCDKTPCYKVRLHLGTNVVFLTEPKLETWGGWGVGAVRGLRPPSTSWRLWM